MIELWRSSRLAKREEKRALVEAEHKQGLAHVIGDFLDKGVLGEHELQVLPGIETKTVGDIRGYISGSIFSIRGEISGHSESQPSIRFAWVTNNEQRRLVISELPSDKFVFQQQPGIERPTVQFRLNTQNFMELHPTRKDPGLEIETKTYPHPNDYLEGGNLRVAEISVSERDFTQLRGFTSRQLPSGER